MFALRRLGYAPIMTHTSTHFTGCVRKSHSTRNVGSAKFCLFRFESKAGKNPFPRTEAGAIYVLEDRRNRPFIPLSRGHYILWREDDEDESPRAHPLAAASPITLPAPLSGLPSQLQAGLVLNYIYI